MDKVKQLAEKYSDKLKYLFIGGAIIGLINTFCRADYNLILYLYMFYVWRFMNNDLESQIREKMTFFYILLYSLIIDIIWCFFWKSKWGLLKEDIESGTHSLVIFSSWIGIFLKIITLTIISVSEWNTVRTVLPRSLSEKLNLNSEYLPQIDDKNL